MLIDRAPRQWTKHWVSWPTADSKPTGYENSSDVVFHNCSKHRTSLIRLIPEKNSVVNLAIRTRATKPPTEVSLTEKRKGRFVRVHSVINSVAFPIKVNLITSIRKVDNKRKTYLQSRSVRPSNLRHLNDGWSERDPRRKTASFLKPKFKTNAEPTSNDAGNYHRYQQMENLDIILSWPSRTHIIGRRSSKSWNDIKGISRRGLESRESLRRLVARRALPRLRLGVWRG